MTIIVLDLDENRILVDTKHSYANGRKSFHATKIQNLDCGIQVALSGVCTAMFPIYKVLNEQSDYLRRPNLYYTCDIPNSDAEGFMRSMDGSVWWIVSREVDGSCHVDIQRVIGSGELGRVYAAGSGAAWFNAYYEEHRHVVKAFDLTVKYCESCGGERQSF